MKFNFDSFINRVQKQEINSALVAHYRPDWTKTTEEEEEARKKAVENLEKELANEKLTLWKNAFDLMEVKRELEQIEKIKSVIHQLLFRETSILSKDEIFYLKVILGKQEENLRILKIDIEQKIVKNKTEITEIENKLYGECEKFDH